ncbi:11861_t:CDS:2 [Funneliformis mosseae]|uniref:11861_t:CDS:1 n=1 Tax=Funneliformis mosseae TaxID=27381 RepID=A0A9N9GTS0_FUNMO|nr:11861_t:CDS:2 [Funneliformis mosseae]
MEEEESNAPQKDISSLVIASTSHNVNSTYNLYIERNRIINGNKVIKVDNSNYALPNDGQGLNVQSLQHSLLKHAWRSNFSSPIHEALKTGGLKVLDVGCGHGAWLLDMCKDYPLCDFVGLDISPVFPSTSSLSPNLSNLAFIQSNALDGLPFKDNTFDFVHQRLWLNALNVRQWEPAIRELKRVCKVGGWLELLETDVVYHNEGINTRNLRASHVCRQIPHFLKSDGSFDEVNKTECDIPLGSWNGKFGELAMKIIYEGYKVIYPELKPIMEVNEEEYEEILNKFVKEANELKTYYKAFRYFCHKFR